MRVSYSKLNMYTNCPQAYKFKYVDGIPEFESNEMKLGARFHEAIHRVLKNLPTDVIDNEMIVQRAKQVVKVITEKYLIVGSEVYFKLPVDAYEFEGFIDLIVKDSSGNIYVLDFKLGSGSFLQTALYAWMLEKAKSKDVHFIGLLKISLNGDEPVSEIIKPFTDEYRQEVQRYISATIQGISEEKFEPKPSENCYKCSYVELCPLRSFVLEKRLESLTLQEKLELVQYIDAFKETLQKQLKDALQNTERIEAENAVAFLEEASYKRLAIKKLPDEVYTTLFDAYGFDAFEPKKELVEEHFPNLFKTVNQKRLKIMPKEG